MCQYPSSQPYEQVTNFNPNISIEKHVQKVQIPCLGTPSIEVTKQEFKSIIFFQPSQLWSLDCIFQRASILTETFLQGGTVTTLAIKG